MEETWAESSPPLQPEEEAFYLISFVKKVGGTGFRRLRHVGGLVRLLTDGFTLDRQCPHVYYSQGGGDLGGSSVKVQRLARYFAHHRRGFNILYILSSSPPPYDLCWLCKKLGIKIVANIDGVYYKAWYGTGWEQQNKPLQAVYRLADYVFFQSEFSKLSAEMFLGPAPRSEVLYNAVDTQYLSPAPRPESRPLTLLTTGYHTLRHRVQLPIRALKLVLEVEPGARLIIGGAMHKGQGAGWRGDIDGFARALVKELGLGDRVIFGAVYTQREAPSVYHGADILIHTKECDPCPNSVIEAMACGLPVVYSATGGTPELVGPDAGIGIPTESSWDEFRFPSAEAYAKAILYVAEHRERYAAAARQRAVEMFDIRPWITRHQAVFNELLGIASEPNRV